MLYALVAARYKAFPEVKTKGMKNIPEMVMFTSKDVSPSYNLRFVCFSRKLEYNIILCKEG